MRNDKRWELFECQRCGKCCAETGLPYDPKNIFEIARFLRLSVDEVLEKYYGTFSDDRKSSEDHKRTPCPFLEEDVDRKSCFIYEVRPPGCRLYPFNTDFGRADVDCPAAKIVYDKLRNGESNQLKGSDMAIYFDAYVMKPGKDDPPFNPIGWIRLNSPPQDEKGMMVITPQLTSHQEVDYYINLLVSELEKTRRDLKRNLQCQ